METKKVFEVFFWENNTLKAKIFESLKLAEEFADSYKNSEIKEVELVMQ